MKNKVLRLTKKPFVRNVIIMATGTASAQVISILSSPLITRLYGPEAYGLMGVFMSFVGIVASIAALTYPTAIVLPKSNAVAKGLIKLSLYVSIIISILVALILYSLNGTIVKVFHLEDVAAYLYLIPLVVLCTGFLQVVEQWLIRTKQFGISAKTSFLQSLLLQGGKVGIGIFHPVASVLVILSSSGNLLKALLMVMFVRKSKCKNVDSDEDSVSITKVAKKYIDFPLYKAPEVLINTLSNNFPILLLTSLFGPASAGFYSIVISVLGIPTQLIGKSVGDVFYSRISTAANNGENLTKMIRKTSVVLGIVGIIPFGTVVLFGPWLFSFAFGAEWLTAGEYSRWIALGTYFGFMNGACVRTLPVLSAQSFQLKYTIFMLVTRVTALLIGFYLFSNDLIAVALFGISGALLNFGLMLVTIRISKNYDVLHMKH